MMIIHIQGMRCQHCAATAKKALENLGATGVVIDLTRGEARFEGALDGEAVRQAIAAKGFTVAE
ncbi:MAG: heavy-metal-associated domain-containing protein [Desulfobulbus sp.]|nr:heavy-metal-associated domain-containing protein [Desulfobulbus sp.]